MPIIANADRKHFALTGIANQTLASHRDGLLGLGIWYQTLQPGAETPVPYHDCEEVIVVLRGYGRAVISGEAPGFRRNSTLIIPTRVVRALVNSADEPMLLIASRSTSPTRVFAPNGTELPVSWVS